MVMLSTATKFASASTMPPNHSMPPSSGDGCLVSMESVDMTGPFEELLQRSLMSCCQLQRRSMRVAASCCAGRPWHPLTGRPAADGSPAHLDSGGYERGAAARP